MNNRKSRYGILALIFFISSVISFYYYRFGFGIVFIILAGIFLVVSRKKSPDNDKNEINDKKDIITTEEKSFN